MTSSTAARQSSARTVFFILWPCRAGGRCAGGYRPEVGRGKPWLASGLIFLLPALGRSELTPEQARFPPHPWLFETRVYQMTSGNALAGPFKDGATLFIR